MFGRGSDRAPDAQGQTLAYDWERRLTGVPVVPVDTEPGDVTRHGRRDARIGPGEAYNDVVRNRTHEAEALR